MTNNVLHIDDRRKLEVAVNDILEETYASFDMGILTHTQFKHDDFINALVLYIDKLETTRHQFNIIGKNENIIEHIIDCLSALPVFIEVISKKLEHKLREKQPITIVDLGTGAGLPGIPLALVFSAMGVGSSWYLVERTLKKASFLLKAREAIEPFLMHSRVHIVAQNLREWIPQEEIDIVTSRAFRHLKDSVNDMKKIGKKAALLLYKGRKETIDEEFSPYIADLLFIQAIYQLTHNQDKERHLVYARWYK